ncbi:MAG: hypothetical protein KJ025_03420 [Burkholderiales bacterium]|nr:hypothetical protein [Burkholderiales bacterium]
MPPPRSRRPPGSERPAARGGAPRAALAAALAALLAAAAAPAHAQVYSWRDSQTGQLRISTVPPPWLRAGGATAAGPKVNVIKDGKVVPPERIGPGGTVLELEPPPPGGVDGARAAAAQAAASVPELIGRRGALHAQLVADALRLGPTSANQAFFEKLDAYLAVLEQLDAADPAGAAARRGERDLEIQRVKANIERVLRDPAQRADFQGEATRWLSRKSDLTAQRIVRCLRDGFC